MGGSGRSYSAARRRAQAAAGPGAVVLGPRTVSAVNRQRNRAGSVVSRAARARSSAGYRNDLTTFAGQRRRRRAGRPRNR